MNRGSSIVLTRARFDAVIFDLDGVITRTARQHASAWKRMFDEFLACYGSQHGHCYAPFDIAADYRRYVDGMPRYDGVQSFLHARGIRLPRGTPGDAPTATTICGLGNRKNELFGELIEREGADVYERAIGFVRRLRPAGFKAAIVSSSKNCARVLKSVGALDLFDVRVDGTHAEAWGLPGKPAPDIFLAAASALKVEPRRAVIVEDALAGVAAGRAGGFGLVIGVDRVGQTEALRDHGADAVVKDLDEIVMSE